VSAYVYILASKKKGTLYIGVTSDLPKRIYQHKNEETGGFSKRYGVKQLVYYEIYEDMENAITREKAMKFWKREWKIKLIESNNPDWQDLFPDIASP
jgi:putative endonuclease